MRCTNRLGKALLGDLEFESNCWRLVFGAGLGMRRNHSQMSGTGSCLTADLTLRMGR